MPRVTVIVPCFENELNVTVTTTTLIHNESLFEKDFQFEYIFVDDGSKDGTFKKLLEFHAQYPKKVKIIKLSRNFGSTNAVFAALSHSSGDCNVVLSADLQDPPELMVKMVEFWKKGFKLVVASRIGREEPLLQRIISNTTHFLIRKLALKNLPQAGFDMNLFDQEIGKILLQMRDKNSFFPYLLMWLGYEFASIPYVRKKRELGVSSYTFWTKLKAFIDSFVAFSYTPIRAISVIGLSLGVIAFCYAIFVIVGHMAGLVPVEGWTSTMVVILFVASFQMIALGIIGEYVWRALDEAKGRPNFVIERVIGDSCIPPQ